MEDLKRNISKNIAELRNREKLTQAELAERLNYSDKAISKWERGESLPDITVLKQIADMFGVTVDWLLKDNTDSILPESSRNQKNHYIIAMLSVLGAWFISIVAFVISIIIEHNAERAWLVFVAAVPVSFVIMLVFNCIWGKLRQNQYIISGLVWSLLALIYLVLLVCFGLNYWFLFFVGIPAQAAVVLSHKIRRK